MKFIVIPSGAYTNTTLDYIVLLSWAGAFTIEDSAGNAASGSVAAYVATNSLIVIPPGFQLASNNGEAYGVSMTFAEFSEFLLG